MRSLPSLPLSSLELLNIGHDYHYWKMAWNSVRLLALCPLLRGRNTVGYTYTIGTYSQQVLYWRFLHCRVQHTNSFSGLSCELLRPIYIVLHGSPIGSFSTVGYDIPIAFLASSGLSNHTIAHPFGRLSDPSMMSTCWTLPAPRKVSLRCCQEVEQFNCEWGREEKTELTKEKIKRGEDS